MRKLSEVTSNIVPLPAPRTFGRRPLSSAVGHLTCLMLFKHGGTEGLLSVSDNNDPVAAVWIPKAMVSIASPDRGRFLVVTLPAKLARDKGLSTPLIERAAFLPEELADLNEAITAAKRTRDRLSGHVQPMGWSGGRNVFA
jgi:hypothetical protein